MISPRTRLLAFFLFICVIPSRAGDGMLIPMLLNKYSMDDMHDEGFRLTADDIYSVNHSSLKDAVVLFGGGCTGEVVSDKGLLFTNHHCGFSYIQSHSSVENDLITNGFWAMSPEEELPDPGLSVSFLDHIEDVTDIILTGITDDTDEGSRDAIIDANIGELEKLTEDKTGRKAVVKSFYYGNEFYLFVYTVFTDVRLVGAPPSSIGNFGRDTDNWIWPRHAGDFSVFRIYADQNNEPADYSPDNVPYKPNYSLPISLDGISDGDFTMVMGYPASTSEYIVSPEIDLIMNETYPDKIALRTTRLDIMKKYMDMNDSIRIMYASKYRGVSNSWKKWKGVIYGMKRVNALQLKKKQEDIFEQWAEQDSVSQKYGNVIPSLYDISSQIADYELVVDYAPEAVMVPEIFSITLDVVSFINGNAGKSDEEKQLALQTFDTRIDHFFKDYYEPIDIETTAAMLEAYHNDISKRFYPGFFKKVHRRFNDDFGRYVDEMFSNTVFNTPAEIHELLSQYPSAGEKDILDKIRHDPVYETYVAFAKVYKNDVFPDYDRLNISRDSLYRVYMKGLMEMDSTGALYPDANFTMRVSYGDAAGYSATDAVWYDYYTTLKGVVEKYNTGIPDYTMPGRLLQLYSAGDYGRYADEDGDLRVCFIAGNHTSGGNSGSPVLNGNGQLVGINFDRNWEGTISDFIFDPAFCRNISVDVRYVLFIIDRFAGAGYLLDEMNITKTD